MLAGGRADRQTDRQTKSQADMTKLTEAFRNFANAPEIDFKYKPLPFV